MGSDDLLDYIERVKQFSGEFQPAGVIKKESDTKLRRRERGSLYAPAPTRLDHTLALY